MSVGHDPRRSRGVAGAGGGCSAAAFLVWRGASGRRYVFSPVAAEDDLDEAVVVAIGARADGRRPRPENGVPRGVAAGATIWAHFLAIDADARRAAIADIVAGGRRPDPFGAAVCRAGGANVR